MKVFFEVNGTRYESAENGSAREVEDRLRMVMSGTEVSLSVRTDGDGSAALHLMGGSVGTYAVWEAEGHTGHQS